MRGLKVTNAGYALKPLEAGEEAPDSLKIRGFKCVKGEALVKEYTQPGDYVLDA